MFEQSFGLSCEHFKCISRVFQEYLFQGIFKQVSKWFKESLKGVLRKFLWYNYECFKAFKRV